MTKHMSDQGMLGGRGTALWCLGWFPDPCSRGVKVWGKSGLGETMACAEALGEETITHCWFIPVITVLLCSVRFSDA